MQEDVLKGKSFQLKFQNYKAHLVAMIEQNCKFEVEALV
jgi:hypothetical protein